MRNSKLNGGMLKLSAAVIALGSAAVLAVGCGSSNSPTGSAGSHAYTAELTPVNPNVSAKAAGAATLIQDGASLRVEMSATGVEPNIMHATRIHLGDHCPTMENDANRDGVIDAAEATAAYGEAIADLTTDANAAPAADAEGNLSYSGVAPMNALSLGASNASGDADLSNRVVVIYGVSDSAMVPAGVDRASLPIACGVLQTTDQNGQTTGQSSGSQSQTTTKGQSQSTSKGQSQSTSKGQSQSQSKQSQSQSKQSQSQSKQSQSQSKQQAQQQQKQQAQQQQKQQAQQQQKQQAQQQQKQQAQKQEKQQAQQSKQQSQSQSKQQAQTQPKTTPKTVTK